MNRPEQTKDMHRILSTAVTIFDCAFTLLAEGCTSGPQLANPACSACVSALLRLMGIGEDADDTAAREAAECLDFDSLT
jgi:hypothetical protein